MPDLSSLACVLGGTFDPIHHGHLHLAHTVSKALQAKITFLPCAQPIHKPAAEASALHRFNMITLAIETHPDWHIDTLEIDSQKACTTYQTCCKLHHANPKQKRAFIIGSDSLSTLTTWHHWQQLADLIHLIVINRTEAPVVSSTEVLKIFQATQDPQDLEDSTSGCLLTLHAPHQAISSTWIRDNLSKGLCTADHMPTPVLSYVQAHQLYRFNHTAGSNIGSD